MAVIEFDTAQANRPTGPQYRPVFTAAQKAEIKKAFKFENVQVYEEAELTGEEVKSDLGHVVLMPVKFESTSWSKRIGKNSYKSDTTGELMLKIAMVELSRTKNVEMTAVDGRDGTIKEYGSHGDYQVNIKGLLTGADGKYPKEDRDTVQLIEEAKKEVEVSGELLNEKGIYFLVIKTLKWIPMEGVENAQAFEMECVSDDPEMYKIDNRT